MSSPPSAPTPSAQSLAKSQSQRSHTQPRGVTGTNPSTPAPAATPGQQATPSSAAPFLSPSLNRHGNLAGKTTIGNKTIANKSLAGKGLPGQHVSPAAAQHGSSPGSVPMMATPSLGGIAGGTTFDSPSHAALAAVGMEPSSSSNPMGLSMSSLGQLGMQGAGANLSSIGMMAGLSHGMLGTSSMGMGGGPNKLDEAERRRRLESVLNMLSERRGRISQEGLERLARRMGLATMRENASSLLLAGEKNFGVDILFQSPSSSAIQDTKFQFYNVNDTTMADFSSAAAVLREDLSPPPGMSSINAGLDNFAKNLEKISKLETLGVDGANCFEAISGMYRSLRKLYDHEKHLAETLADHKRELAPEAGVTCTKSGQPKMNMRKTVGLSIEYWRDQHLIPPVNSATPTLHIPRDNSDEHMPDADSLDAQAISSDDNVKSYTLHVDIESCPSSVYQPIRSSSAWISLSITKSVSHVVDNSDDHPDTQPREVDWLEPPVFVPSKPETPPLEARFTAQLDPPVVLPLNVAAQILASVGADLDLGHEQMNQTTYESLMLGDHPRVSQRATPNEALVFSPPVLGFNDEKQQEHYEHSWETRLYFPRPELARALRELPFSHPKQLVALLPVLRQYLLFAKLIRSAAVVPYPIGGPQSDPTAEFSNEINGTNIGAENGRATQDELDLLLAPTPSSDAADEITDPDVNMDEAARPAKGGRHPTRVIDLTIGSLTPVPRLTLIVPTAMGLLTAHISITVDADLSVSVSNDAVDALLAEHTGEHRTRRKHNIELAMAKALATVEDLPVWAEWTQRKLAS